MDLSTCDKCSCNTARRTWVYTWGMPFLCDRGQGPEPLKLRLATCGVDKPQLSSRASGETDERAAVSCWAECPTRIRPSRRSVSFPSRLLSLFRPFLKTMLPYQESENMESKCTYDRTRTGAPWHSVALRPRRCPYRLP